MQEPNLFALFTSKLNEQELNYVVTGSVASIVYGEPRLTHDIDIVLELAVANIENLIAAFPADEFYVPPFEVVKNEVLRSERGHFNLIHYKSGFKADLYLMGKSEFQGWALAHKKEVAFQGVTLFIAPPEYVIIKKLEYYKEGHSDKHLADVRSMLENSKEIIDVSIVEKYSSQFGLTELWRQVI